MSKTTAVGVTPKISSLWKISNLLVEEIPGDFEVGKSLATEAPGEAIYKTDTNLVKVPQEEILVSHHTLYEKLKLIKKSRFLDASRGEPFGVDVELPPFVNPTEANLGQSAKGSYIDFMLLKVS